MEYTEDKAISDLIAQPCWMTSTSANHTAPARISPLQVGPKRSCGAVQLVDPRSTTQRPRGGVRGESRSISYVVSHSGNGWDGKTFFGRPARRGWGAGAQARSCEQRRDSLAPGVTMRPVAVRCGWQRRQTRVRPCMPWCCAAGPLLLASLRRKRCHIRADTRRSQSAASTSSATLTGPRVAGGHRGVHTASAGSTTGHVSTREAVARRRRPALLSWRHSARGRRSSLERPGTGLQSR